MEELIEKTNNLIESLEDSKEIKELKEKKKELDSSLLEDIKTYQETQDEKLRDKIIKNPDFRDYKKKENDCNFLILEINQELKKITGKDKTCHENH